MMPKNIAKKTATRQASPAATPANHGLSPDARRSAALYCRVSKDDREKKSFSLLTQREACMALAQQEGYTVLPDHVFNEDYTGKTLTRPELFKLRDLVASRQVQAVFVHDLDRLSRKLAHQLLLTEECARYEVELRIVLMPDTDDSPEGQLLTHVKGVIAEYERAKILERTARGRRGRAQAGHVPGGRRTFGYLYVKHPSPAKGAHYEIHPEEAALVRRIFWLYIHAGLSDEAIAALLTREGVLTPGARLSPHIPALDPSVWARSTIAYMLRNTTYLGEMGYGKRLRLPGIKNPDRNTRWKAAPEGHAIPVPVPAILDPETFAAAQAQRRKNPPQSRRNRQQDYLLIGGRLRCGQCGCAMSGAMNDQGHARYRCSRRSYQEGIAPHVRRHVMATAIEPFVWGKVESALKNPELIAAAIAEQQEETSTQQAIFERERHAYTTQLCQCDKDLKRWEAAYLGEAIDLNDFKAKKAEITVRRASAERELALLTERERASQQATLDLTSLVEYCARVRANLHSFSLAEKHRALEALDIRVIWHPDRTPEIHGSVPLETDANAPRCIRRNIPFVLAA